MFARLVRLEFVRIGSRPGFWLLVAVNTAFVLFAEWSTRHTIFPGDGLSAPIALANGCAVLSLLPVMAPFVMGDSLAADRQNGYLSLQMARGVGRTLPALTRGSAAVIAGTAAAWLCALPGVALAYLLHPAVGGTPRAAVAFMPDLLSLSPLLYLVTLGCLYGLAAGAISCVSLAVGSVIPKKGVSSVSAVFLLTLGILIPIQWLNPLERVMFASTWGSAWTRPLPMLLYWLALGGTAVSLAALRMNKGDDAC